jgi:ERCC4-type nuclease
MLIKLDFRETDLHAACVQYLCMQTAVGDRSKFQITTDNLPIGDAIIYDNSGNERIIIERKTLNDLASSIRDGRYSEQSFRLHNCSLHNHNIYYLVEGSLAQYNAKKTRLDRRALLSSMTTISHFKGFSLHRTNSTGESAEWIINLADKLDRESRISFYTGGEAHISDSAYCSVVKRVKKDNVTPENIGEIMLTQIPGVSSATAEAIMERFGTIKELIRVMESDQHTLDPIRITTKTGKTRKINKNARSNIYNFLVDSSSACISVDTV